MPRPPPTVAVASGTVLAHHTRFEYLSNTNPYTTQVDWRLGAAHFESLLLDYDPSSNVGNWLSIAGLTGGRVSVFNMDKQARLLPCCTRTINVLLLLL